MTEFFFERSRQSSPSILDVRQTALSQTTNDEDDDDFGNGFMALEENPRSKEIFWPVIDSSNILSVSRADSGRVSSRNFDEETDNKGRVSVEEMGSVNHDEAKEEDRELEEDMDEENDFFGLKNADENEMKVNYW